MLCKFRRIARVRTAEELQEVLNDLSSCEYGYLVSKTMVTSN